MSPPVRLVPIPRVSRTGDRAAADLHSPGVQLSIMQRDADAQGFVLLAAAEEINVSGTLDAEDRPGVQHALGLVTAGEADGVMFSDFSRASRGKMEQLAAAMKLAGGGVYAVGHGWIEYDDPDKATMFDLLDVMGKHVPRVARQKGAAGKRAAILLGRSPKQVPVGYDKDADKLLRRNAHAPHVLEAYRRRADGATLAEVHAYLTSVGIKRSWYGVQTLLRQTDYTGDLIVRHLGETLTVPAAHDQIVPWELFNEVQAMTKPSGRRAKSDYLLARLGVLKDHRGMTMVAGPGGANGRTPRHYRTMPTQLAPGEKIVTIGAHIVEPIVWEIARTSARRFPGSASLRAEAQRVELEHAETAELLAAKLTAMAAATSVAAVEAITPQIEAAQIQVDTLAAQAQRLRVQADQLVLDPDDPDLELADRRAIIEVTIARVVIVPATEAAGAARVTVIPFETA